MATVEALLQDQALVYQQSFSMIKSMAVKCAMDLGIPDIIHRRGQPVPLSDLEAELQVDGAKADALRRLMRLLVHMRCFSGGGHGGEGSEEDTYDLTAFSRLLLKGNPKGLWHYLNTMLSPDAISAWNVWGAWFKGNQPKNVYEMAHGRSVWDAAAADPAFNELVNEMMAGDSRLVVDVAVRECGDAFQGLRSLVDVGGGNGSAAKAIAAAFPGLKCTVFDLPHVIASVPKDSHVVFVGGDMFDRVPRADAVLLKNILHDWGDDDCVKILKRCKEAIPPKEDGGKVIVIDAVVNSCKEDPQVTEAQYLFDMVMMAAFGGKEREEHEWRKIFAAAGFGDYKITHKLGARSLIEAYP